MGRKSKARVHHLHRSSSTSRRVSLDEVCAILKRLRESATGEGFPDHCLHPIACLGLSLWVILGLHLKGRTSRQTETGDA